MPLPIPQQVLSQPVTAMYKGKALRQGLARAESEQELLDLQIEQAKNPQPDPKEQREAIKFVETGIAEAGATAINMMRSNPEAAPEEITSAFNEHLARVLPQAAYEKVVSQYDKDGNGVIDSDGLQALEAFSISKGTLTPLDDKKTTVLSLDEKLEMGMREDWAAASVVERDEAGNITVNNQPTGLTEQDVEARGSVNASGQSKNTIEFQDAVIGAVGAIQTGTELMTASVKNPEALGVPGGMMRFGSNLVSGATALADWAGYEKPSPEDTEKQVMGASSFNYDSLDLGKLGVSGAEAEKFRAGVYGIAFAAAVAEQGTRPTDKDIQQFIDQVGGRATSAQSFRETIAQFMRRQDRRIKTIADVKQISGVDREAALSAWTPAYREFMEKYASSTGRNTATNPETGQRFIEMSSGDWEEF